MAAFVTAHAAVEVQYQQPLAVADPPVALRPRASCSRAMACSALSRLTAWQALR